MRKLYLALSGIFFLSVQSDAATFTSNVFSGNWLTPGSWVVAGIDPDGIPDANDDVIINTGNTITMNGNAGACLSLLIRGTAAWTQVRTTAVGAGGINITATGNITGNVNGVLTTDGGLILNAVLSSNTVSINIQTTGGQSMSGTGSLALLAVNQTITNTGTITVRTTLSGSSTLTNGANGSLILSGASTISGLTATAVPNLVTYNGSAAQTVKGATYYNLTVNKPAGIAANITSAVTVSNDFTISSGTADIGGVNMVVGGNTSVTGTLSFSSAAGTKSFRNITVNSGGTMTCSATPSISLSGNLALAGGTITGSATGSYTVTGTFTVTAASTLGRSTLAVTGASTVSSTLTVNSATGTKNLSSLTVASGGSINSTAAATFAISGNLVLSGGSITGSATSIYNVGGAFNVTASSTLGASTLAVTGNTTVSSTLTVSNATGTKTLNNLTVSSGGTINCTAAETFTVNGNLVLSGGVITGSATAVYTVAGVCNVTGSSILGQSTLTVTGTTTVSSTLTINSATGTKTFSNLTVTGTGNWNNTANSNIAITGNLLVNGTFTGGTGTYTFSGSGKTISGSTAINMDRATVTGTYTNNSTALTVSTALAGSGTLTQGVSSVLNLGGTATITGFTATANPNLVNYNGTGNQTMLATTYHNLQVNKTGGTATFGGNTTINGNFTVLLGTASITNNTLLVSGNTSITGRFNVTNISGTKTFGNVTINSGGRIDCSANETLTINGNLAMAGGQISGTGATGIFNVSGTFTVTAASTLGRATLSVTGASTISSTLNITSTTGTKTFGDLSVLSPGNWNPTVNEDFSIGGDIVVTGTFTSGTGIYSLTGAGKTISGTTALSISNITVTGSYTSNVTLTVPTSLIGAGSFTQGVSSTLNIAATNANFSVTTFNASGAGNLVNYNRGGNQNVRNPNNGSYRNLRLSTSGTKSLVAATTVNGNLVISAATLDVTASNFALNVSGNWTNTGTFTPRSGTVTFNGTSVQSITRAGGETFFNMTCASSSTVQLVNNIIVNNNLTVNSGTLDVTASNSSVRIGRNWTNTASFNARSGNVTFAGSVAQQLSGSTAWYDVTISNTAGGVSITSGTHSISNSLSFTTATSFAIGSNVLTLNSDASTTARIGQLPAGASITGSMVVQRYVSTRVANYADLASPVQAATIAEWDTRPDGVTNEIYMSGVGGPDGNAWGPGNSVFTYDEPTAAFKAVTTQATVLNPGRGFELFLGDNMSQLNAFTFDSRGTPNQGTQNLGTLGDLSFTSDGYNLVGNPFASYISWNSVLASSTNIDNTYLIFDAASGSYVSYGAGSEIPPHQGFYVHATASPTMLISESAKTTTTTSVFHKQEGGEQLFELKLYSSDGSLPYMHRTKMDFNPVSQNEYDAGDMPFLKSPLKEAPSVTTLTADGKEMCLNRMNTSSATLDVPVRTSVGVGGSYTLEAQHLDHLGEYACAVLEDKALGVFTDLRSVNHYSFDITPGQDENRFVLHLSKAGNCISLNTPPVGEISSDKITVLQNGNSNLVNLELTASKQVQVTVVNVLGELLAEPVEVIAKEKTIQLSLPGSFSGIYFISVSVDGKTTTQKFLRL